MIGVLVGDFADGVWLVDLARLVDAAQVPQSISETLGSRETPGHAPPDALTDNRRRQGCLRASTRLLRRRIISAA